MGPYFVELCTNIVRNGSNIVPSRESLCFIRRKAMFHLIDNLIISPLALTFQGKTGNSNPVVSLFIDVLIIHPAGWLAHAASHPANGRVTF